MYQGGGNVGQVSREDGMLRCVGKRPHCPLRDLLLYVMICALAAARLPRHATPCRSAVRCGTMPMHAGASLFAWHLLSLQGQGEAKSWEEKVHIVRARIQTGCDCVHLHSRRCDKGRSQHLST